MDARRDNPPEITPPMTPRVPPPGTPQDNPRYADVERMPSPRPTPPNDDPIGPIPMTYITPHQLIQMLVDAAAKVSRNPDGQDALLAEIQDLHNQLATPGYNPNPADMHAMHEHVADVAERARMLDVARATPAAVTLDDIEQRFDTATESAKLLKVGREAALADIEAVGRRLDAVVEPHSQADLDMIHLAILTVLTRIEQALSRQT